MLAQDDDWLISRFRLSRAIPLDLCAELAQALQRETGLNRALPVLLQGGMPESLVSSMIEATHSSCGVSSDPGPPYEAVTLCRFTATILFVLNMMLDHFFLISAQILLRLQR